MKEQIDQVLSTRTTLESDVIKLRYGLSNGFTYAYDEIGKQLGITPERVAEIEKEAEEKLRLRKPQT